MHLPELAWHSLKNRRFSAALTVVSVMLSVVVVIGVEHLRSEARASFSRSISGVDLIVGARTSQLNLLLYSVFRIGSASNGIEWENYQKIAADPRVAWSIPLALGDSHQGYPVLGTTQAFFQHSRYGQDQPLTLRDGKEFAADDDVVLGYDVARALGYDIGSKLVISHGLASASFSLHRGHTFLVSGILAPTGTPVDKTLHLSLTALENLHGDPQAAHQSTPEHITAFMLGLHNRAAAFTLQRDISTYQGEPLTAILPGIALAELWQGIGTMERVLGLVSALVMVATLLGLATMLLSSLRERSHEMALYRALGAHASTILLLIEAEALLLVTLGVVAGLIALHLALRFGQGWLGDHYGLLISPWPYSAGTGLFVLVIFAAAAVIALVPALLAYRNSLAAGLRPHG